MARGAPLATKSRSPPPCFCLGVHAPGRPAGTGRHGPARPGPGRPGSGHPGVGLGTETPAGPIPHGGNGGRGAGAEGQGPHAADPHRSLCLAHAPPASPREAPGCRRHTLRPWRSGKHTTRAPACGVRRPRSRAGAGACPPGRAPPHTPLPLFLVSLSLPPNSTHLHGAAAGGRRGGRGAGRRQGALVQDGLHCVWCVCGRARGGEGKGKEKAFVWGGRGAAAAREGPPLARSLCLHSLHLFLFDMLASRLGGLLGRRRPGLGAARLTIVRVLSQ